MPDGARQCSHAARVDRAVSLIRVRHWRRHPKRVGRHEAAHVSQDRRHGVGMGVAGSPVRKLFMASAAAHACSAACCWLIGSQMKTIMLS